jgi:Outer membrane protein beta-barrel domain
MNITLGWKFFMTNTLQQSSFLWLLLLPSLGFAQQAKTALTCENDLDDAKNAYYAGDLQAVEDKIESSCLQASLYSRPKMVEGYRLLTESFLFRDENRRAQESFEKLLHYNPLFEVDSTDPNASYDLIHLSRTYRRSPVISIYGSIGLNYSRVNTLQQYRASNSVTSKSDYSQITVGWNANLGFEVPIYKNYDFLMEANFSSRSFARTDSLYIVQTPTNNAADATAAFAFGSMQFKEVQHWLDVPIMGRYNYYWRKKIIPYAYVGVAPNFLIRSALRGITRRNVTDGRGGGQVVGNEKEIIVITKHIATDENGAEDKYVSTYNSLRNMFNVSLLAGVGCKFRIERNFMFFDIRYNRFLLNAVDINNRYSQKELLYKYAYVDNDFRLDNVSVSFGFVRSFYKPRKTREYDPALAALAFDKAQKKQERQAARTGQTIRGTNSQETQRNVKEDAEEAKRKEKQRKNFIDDVRAGRRTVNSINE